MRSDLLNAPVYKFSGRIEHWVTTFHQGFWGLPESEESKWRDISKGDVFLFHGTGPKYVDDNDAGGGVIGVGVVGGFDEKTEDVWLEERQGGRSYPYLIYFEEMYWFGDTRDIRDVSVSEKDESEIIDDCYALSENILSFKEMRTETGYSFNPMGVMSEVKEIQKLRRLLNGRLEEAEEDTRETPSAEHASECDTGFVTSSRRSRGDSEDLHVSGGQEETRYVRDTEDIQRKNKAHERILDALESRVEQSGYRVSETRRSDLIAVRGKDQLLAEAKYIHEDNEEAQIRKAIGQLFEYRYYDFRRQEELIDDPVQFLVFNQRPSDRYAAFLQDLQNDGVYTIWVKEEMIKGLSDSASALAELLRT